MIPSDQNALYLRLRDGCGMVALKDWTTVTVAGADRQKFVQSFCTNDVTSSAKCEAFFLNAKGKIVGHGLVLSTKDEIMIIGAPGQGPALVAHLDRYVIREDVQLRDSTADFANLLLTGKDAISPRWGEGVVLWSPLATEVRMLLQTTAADFEKVRDERIRLGTALVDAAVFEMLRIESGYPLFGIDFNSENLPQEVGRNEQAISFNKGCYLGQETVARIDALGHVNQQIAAVRFEAENVPPVGIELTHEGKVAGRVTSAAFSPQLGAPLALAMVRREWLAPGTKLESAAGPCEIVKLPLAV